MVMCLSGVCPLPHAAVQDVEEDWPEGATADSLAFPHHTQPAGPVHKHSLQGHQQRDYGVGLEESLRSCRTTPVSGASFGKWVPRTKWKVKSNILWHCLQIRDTSQHFICLYPPVPFFIMVIEGHVTKPHLESKEWSRKNVVEHTGQSHYF